MRASDLLPSRPQESVHGIDRMVNNVQTGRFERSLSALTAVGALVTAAEIYFEHDSASFGNKMMWIPVVLGPVGAAAGVAGFFSRRMAKTALPVASAAIVANGLQGTYLHARGISQKPGGWSNARYNIEMGPPLLAPLLVTRAAAVAASYGLQISGHCAPHLHAHAAAAVPNLRHLEWFHDHVRIESTLFDGTLDPSGGVIRPDPAAPGLGLTFRDADAERYRAG